MSFESTNLYPPSSFILVAPIIKQEMIEKISVGKLGKFITDNTLLNQEWIMDPKMKVSDILKNSKIVEFIRYKVGEGV